MNYSFGIRFISNLQHLCTKMKLRSLGLEPFKFDNLTTFIIRVDTTFYSVVVKSNLDPNTIVWCLVHQSGKDTSELRDAAKDAFRGTKYERKLAQWVSKLKRTGYFQSIVLKYGECTHCGKLFKTGTSHEYTTMNDGSIVHHHRKLYQKAKKLGLEPTWKSFIPPGRPSLEELGELEQYTIY